MKEKPELGIKKNISRERTFFENDGRCRILETRMMMTNKMNRWFKVLRFDGLVSISFYPKRWPSWGFCSWWEAHGFLRRMVFASLSYIPSMLVVMLSHSR